MIEQISQLVSELRNVLLEVGIKPTGIAFKKEKIEQAPEKQQEHALAWLKGFKDVYVRDYQKAKSLVPKLTQAMYELSKLSYKTYEEDEVKESRLHLIEAWRKRPAILQRNANVKDGKTGAGFKSPATKGNKSGASGKA